MNIITKAIDTVKFNIPMELLKIAFKDDAQNAWRRAPLSIDDIILNEVIRPRIIIDTNLVGGEMLMVPLDGLLGKSIDQFSMVYEIPPERLNYRTLMSVLSVGYLRGTGYGFQGYSNAGQSGCSNGMSDLSMASRRVGDSMSSIPNVSTAKCDIVGHNTVLIYEQAGITGLYELRCLVANEENMNNISPRSYLPFAELVLYGVKSYIYNKLIVKIGSSYLSGGQELGAIKDLVESYSDSEENYNTYLKEVWAKVSIMNDTPMHDRLIKAQINPAL